MTDHPNEIFVGLAHDNGSFIEVECVDPKSYGLAPTRYVLAPSPEEVTSTLAALALAKAALVGQETARAQIDAAIATMKRFLPSGPL